MQFKSGDFLLVAFSHVGTALNLSDPTEIANTPAPIGTHLSHDPCRTLFSAVSQTIAATHPLLSVKIADRGLKTGLGRGYRRKACLCSLSRYREHRMK